MNPTVIITIGGVAGYVVACLLFGSRLPLLSAPAILGIFLGSGAGVGVMFVAARMQERARSPDSKAMDFHEGSFTARMHEQARLPDKTTLQESKDEIMANLHSQNADIRADAMTKLAMLRPGTQFHGDLDSVTLLILGLKDTDRMVRLRATEALRNVTGQDFGEDIENWMEWWADNGPFQR